MTLLIVVYTPTRTSSNEQLEAWKYMNCSPLELETVTLMLNTDEVHVFLVYIENEDSILLLLVQPVLCLSLLLCYSDVWAGSEMFPKKKKAASHMLFQFE